MIKTLSLAIVTALAIGTTHAQDADLHVIVKFDSHRTLSPTLRQSFREQVGQALNSALQGLGRARVFDFDAERPEDRMSEWDRSFQMGFDKLHRVAHGNRVKSHYVHVGFHDGAYRVSSRQADGQLGWCSPIVRNDSTPDRESVARIAIYQLLSDYGLTGTIAQFDGDRTATIRFPGSNLSDAQLREWVRVGDPFAVVRISSPGRCDTVPHAYFIATGVAEGGQVTGKIEYRFTKPLAGWEAGQFRAVKLGATSNTVRLRLVGPNDATPANVSVQVFATGLSTGDAERERGQARGGRFVSTERYDRMAYVKLSLGERLLAKVPVAVLGSDPAIIEINTDPGGESAVLAQADARTIKTQLNDLLVRVGEESEQLRGLINSRKNQQALAKVTELLRQLDVEIHTIADAAILLRSRSPAAGPSLDEIDRSVRELKQHEQTLLKTKTDLERSINTSATPEAEKMRQGLKVLVARADREAQEADYDKAIATLEDVLKQAGDWPEIKTRLEDWKRGWAIKSDAHRAARSFVTDVWAKAANVDDVNKNIDRVKQSFKACKEAGDKMTTRKIYLVLVKAAGWIELRDKELRRSTSDDVEKQGEELRKLTNQVKSLLGEVESYIK